jgi:hypothetical protein
MRPLFAFIVMYILSWGGCKGQSSQPQMSTPAFALYKLLDSTTTADSAWDVAPDSLILSPTPFLTQNDLVAYYWSTHSFKARPNIDTMFSQMRWLAGKTFGVPFVVVAGNSRVYNGAFWWPYSSLRPKGTYIDASLPSPYSLKRDQLASLPDMRSDQRIHDALSAANVLVE